MAVRDVFGQWTYQFCVTVDDLHDGVNLIVRGEDLLPSTGRQWLLARLLGRTEPFVTAHHPLLHAADRPQAEQARSERDGAGDAGAGDECGGGDRGGATR